jgi:hypothetical protein
VARSLPSKRELTPRRRVKAGPVQVPLPLAARPATDSFAPRFAFCSNQRMHRFGIGQTVFVPWAGAVTLVPSGTYVVVRLLPPIGGEPHYRVKSTSDGRQRALLESQMRPLPPEPTREQPSAVAGARPEGAQSGQSTRPTARAQAANLSTQPTKKKAAPEAPPSLGRKRPRKQTTGSGAELLRRAK